MIREVMKICGLDCDEICAALADVAGDGVDFEVEENCLDAKITMTSELDKKSFDAVKSRVYNLFSEQVYSAEDVPLHELAAKLLKLNGRMLAVAESLTGGEICSRLTRVPGISENFYEGVVCYNRGAKMHRLRIPKDDGSKVHFRYATDPTTIKRKTNKIFQISCGSSSSDGNMTITKEDPILTDEIETLALP